MTMHGGSLLVQKLDTTNWDLSEQTRTMLSRVVHNSDDVPSSQVVYAAKVIPFDIDDVVKQGEDVQPFLKTWCQFLNTFHATGRWVDGVLSPPILIPLAKAGDVIGLDQVVPKGVGPRCMIVTYMFVTRKFAASGELIHRLNRLTRWDAFVMEGELGSDDWSKYVVGELEPIDRGNLTAEQIAEVDKQDIVRRIDLKHHINSLGQIVKSGNGQVILEDEPLILFRARDRLAFPLLLNYLALCRTDGCNDYQLGQLGQIVDSFSKWAATNPDKMKQPGITRGL